MSNSSTVISEPGTKPKLRLTTVASEGTAETAQAEVFSSIKQTAVALATAARGQASRRARGPGRGLSVEVDAAERLESAVLRATAEQARRVAEAARAAFDAFARHTFQPCLALDESGRIVRWNDAAAAWIGVPETVALGLSLTDIFADEASDTVQDACAALRDAELLRCDPGADPVFTIDSAFALKSGAAAQRIAMIPLCRVPRVVEEIVLLITPTAPQK